MAFLGAAATDPLHETAVGETLVADDVADVVEYMASRPRRLNLRHIVVLPTRQA